MELIANEGSFECCAHASLSNQLDFNSQKSALQEVLDPYGYIPMFYPESSIANAIGSNGTGRNLRGMWENRDYS